MNRFVGSSWRAQGRHLCPWWSVAAVENLTPSTSILANYAQTTAKPLRVASSPSSSVIHTPPTTRSFTRSFSASPSPPLYHIEASNAEYKDATVLTVRGPDVDGILASMTVALAVKGCSLVQLHAAMDADVSHDKSADKKAELIKDIFIVVDRTTGKPFPDEKLTDLAMALLEATQAPLNVLSMKGAADELEKLEHHISMIHPEQQITIIPSTAAKDIQDE